MPGTRRPGRTGSTALRLIDRARQHPSERLDGALYPAQVDTCTEELLRDNAAAARERRLPLQIHTAQSVVEFQEIMRRHGKTPIGWLHQIGVLGDNAIMGHAIFLDHWAGALRRDPDPSSWRHCSASTPPKCLPDGSASTPRSRACVRTASSEALAAFLRRAGRGRYAHPTI